MSNIDKQALREEFQFMQEQYSDPADRDRQLIYIAAEALLDELEAKDKQVAELQARDQPKFVQCWSCKRAIEVLAIADCDGYCPRCAAPIDLDDEPYAAGIGKGGEYDRSIER